MKTEFIDINIFDCNVCSSNNLSVRTRSKKQNWFHDGDLVECKNCGNIGQIAIEYDSELDIIWNNELDEN